MSPLFSLYIRLVNKKKNRKIFFERKLLWMAYGVFVFFSFLFFVNRNGWNTTRFVSFRFFCHRRRRRRLNSKPEKKSRCRWHWWPLSPYDTSTTTKSYKMRSHLIIRGLNWRNRINRFRNSVKLSGWSNETISRVFELISTWSLFVHKIYWNE